MTIYGDSVSAMVSLSVTAMAQGKTLSTGHVLTGTVTPDGEIGPVGSVLLKVQAAKAARLRRVVVSKHTPTGEHAGNLPVSIQVSPVQSVPEALDALTDSPARQSTIIEVERR
jgi:predicted S18 family serine protease